MTASRPSYEVSLISEGDERWASDKSRSHCYVCERVKLSKGKRHHCRLCGNISCRNCCPRICKRCLAEHIASSSRSTADTSTWEQMQRLFKLKSQQIRWKKVEMADKVYFEPLYVVSEDISNCIVRSVDGEYYHSDSNALFAAPQKENMLDSLQSLVHGFINRSAESSLSLKKPLYALQQEEEEERHRGHRLPLSLPKRMRKQSGKGIKGTASDLQTESVLKRCHIFSFYPMLQREWYKLEGFMFKEQMSFNKTKLNNVQFFHFVSDQESPSEIPAYTPSTKTTVTVTPDGNADDDDRKINVDPTNDMMLSMNTRRKSASLSGLGTKSMAMMEMELDSFKRGYREMRKSVLYPLSLFSEHDNGSTVLFFIGCLLWFCCPFRMYEEYVKATEAKLEEFTSLRDSENENTIERLQGEVDRLSITNEEYESTMKSHREHIDALQGQLHSQQTQYQQKLDSQSSKFMDSTLKTNTAASSKLIESFKTLETAHQEIDRLRKQVEALKAMKSGNTQNEITSFRLKKEQQRSAEMERKLQEQTVTLKSVRKQLRKQQEREQIVSNPVVEPISIRIAREVEEMSKVDHSKLFDILFDFMSSHRGMWNEQYINALIHELLFNVLMESFAAIQRFAESVSLALCKELGINKAILNESFYSEWIDGSKCHIFLHSAAAVGVVKSAVTDGVFMEQFMTKHLGLSSHQIPQEIHLEFASFLTKCIDISWKMSVQSPALQFTPNAFRPDAAKKMNFYDELHCVRHGDEASKHILYFLWPIVTANGFHSVMDGMKIAVCLGDTMPTKSGKDDEGVDDEEMSVEREESMGMVIFNHDPDEYQGSPSDVYQQHLHEISDESPFVAIY